MLRSIALFLLFLAAGNVYSQTYYFTRHSGGNPPHGANNQVLNTQRDDAADDNNGNWSLVSVPANSSSYSGAIFLPFSFQFQGNSVNACKVSSTGFITFDTSVTGAPAKGPELLPSASLPAKSVVLWGLKNKGQNDKILARVFGTAPNRQFWIKFASFSSGQDTASNGTYNYISIVLEETTNNIHLVFMHQGQEVGDVLAPYLNPGIQANSTTAWAVHNSDTTKYVWTSGKNYSDNFYYTFFYGNPLDYDLELHVTNAATTVKTGNLTTVGYTLWNNGIKKVDSTVVYYTINNGALQQSKIYPALQPGRLNSFEKNLTGITVLGAPGTLYNIKLWVAAANGQPEINQSNDTALHTLVAVNGTGVAGKILLESGTATWCNTCPVANRTLAALKERYKDTLVLVQHHLLDEMVGNNDSLFDYFYNDLPEVMLNRKTWNNVKGQSVDSVENRIEKIKKSGELIPASVEVKNVAINETTREISYEVSAIFADHYYGEISLAGMVLENNVRGTGAGFNQSIKNTLTDDVSDWYYGFTNPIIGYYHDNVVWNLGGGVSGKKRAAKYYAKGDTVSEVFTYVFPELLKKATIVTSPYLPIGEVFSLGKPVDMRAVGYIAAFNNGDQKIWNSNEAMLWDVDLEVRNTNKNTMSFYPNPVKNRIYISAPLDTYQLQIMNGSGQTIYSSVLGNNGSTGLEVPLAELLPSSGLYLLRITGSNGWTASARVVYAP